MKHFTIHPRFIKVFKLKVMTAEAVKLHAPQVRTPIPIAGEEKVISQHKSSTVL